MSDAREIVKAILDRVLEEMENVIKEVLQEDAISILEFPTFERMEFNWTEIDPIYKG